MHKIRGMIRFAFVLVLLLITSLPIPSYADHAWGNYHWARTSNPFTVRMGNNLSSNWSPYLSTTSYDWSLSAVLNAVVVPGITNPKKCRATNGRVEVCNSRYGNNGWLGIAQIWTSGNHIVRGTVKLNDTYFNGSGYNNPAWKNLVMCQEVGHTLGLDHQDEDFYNAPLGTCMDYSSDPYPNQHPDAHDYEELEIIYAHSDGFNPADFVILPDALPTIDTEDLESPSQWGKRIRSSNQKRTELFELDMNRGQKMFTFVIWEKPAKDH